MNAHDSFLQAICERPEDDTPRLIYADWLDENGQPKRAEFIRLQIELSRADEFDPRASAWRAREEALDSGYRNAWQPEVPSKVRYLLQPFRRGFVALLSRDAADWLKRPDRWDALTPVEGVDLRKTEGRVAKIAANPHLSRLRWLSIQFNQEDARQLASSKHLIHLDELDLSNSSLTATDVGALARAEFPRLTTLNLDHTSPEAAGLAALVSSEQLPSLRKLSLAYGGAETLDEVAEQPGLSRIAWLDLQGNELRAEGLACLARSPYVRGLRHLGLVDTLGHDTGAHALGRAEGLMGLLSLDYSNNHLTTTGVVALARSRHLSALRVLRFAHNRIGPDGARSLSRSSTLAGLRQLDLTSTGIRDEGLKALAGSKSLAGLEGLWVGFNNITEVGLTALAESPHLHSLTSLGISGNNVKKGISVLASSPVLRNLTELSLGSVGVRGAQALARSPHLSKLHRLHLDDSIGEKGVLALAESPHLPDGPTFLLGGIRFKKLSAKARAALRARRWRGSAM